MVYKHTTWKYNMSLALTYLHGLIWATSVGFRQWIIVNCFLSADNISRNPYFSWTGIHKCQYHDRLRAYFMIPLPSLLYVGWISWYQWRSYTLSNMRSLPYHATCSSCYIHVNSKVPCNILYITRGMFMIRAFGAVVVRYQGRLLLTWFNFNLSKDKQSHAQ